MLEWRAVYEDGSSLSQYKVDGSENSYADIDRTKLTQFLFLSNDKLLVVIHLDQNKKLIYRRRVAIHFAGAKEGQTEVVYLVGWQERKQGVNFQMICFVFSDHIEIRGGFKEGHPWFYSVKFRPDEMV